MLFYNVLFPPFSEMKMNFGFDEEDKILGALILGRVDPSREFRSVRGPIEKKLHFRVEA